jgi:hypothetical protein
VSPEGKILDRAADRAERIANNPKAGRPEARRRQAAVGSNTGQKVYELTSQPALKKDDQ